MSNHHLKLNNQPYSLQINLIQNSKLSRPTRITPEIAIKSTESCNSNAEMVKTCIGEYIQQRKAEVCPGLNDSIMILTTPNEITQGTINFGFYTVKIDIETFNLAITCCHDC